MQVSATKAAIEVYVNDLSSRAHGDVTCAAEVTALRALLPVFAGFLTKPFTSFAEVAGAASFGAFKSESDDPTSISQAIPPLERLLALMSVIATAERRNDLGAFINLLKTHESVKIAAFVKAVQYGRRGERRPVMSIQELKNNLDSSLGDEEKFEAILAELRLLSDADFDDVAKTALRVPYKTKKQGIQRLIRLHKSTMSHRSKQSSTTSWSAA